MTNSNLYETNFYKNNDIIEVRQIFKGNSSAHKFYVKTNDDKEFLLKFSLPSKISKIKSMAKYMKILTKANIPMPHFIEYEICKNGEICSIETWCSGKAILSLIKKTNENEAYKLGVQAGIVLRQIHNVSIRATTELAYERAMKRRKTRVNRYKMLEDNSDPLLNSLIHYFENYNYDNLRERMGDRCICHLDFHSGNILYCKQSGIKIIDWTLVGRGNPFEDLVYATYDALRQGGNYEFFAAGQLDGYLHHMELDSMELNKFRSFFSFYFARKILGRTKQSIRRKQSAKISNRIAKNYKMFNWLNKQCGLESFDFSNEVLEKIKNS